MSNYYNNNQCCSYLFKQQSFSPFTQFNTPLKPSLATFRPIFTFNNCFRKRPRCRKFPPLVARSSSDIVLIATTEHHDGSLVFRFGDASEVVKNDDVVEEVESPSEQEGNVLKVLDADHDIQVIIKTVEVDDGIRKADTDSDVDEKETNVISDLNEEEAPSLQPDVKLNKYLKILEGTLNEIDGTSQLEGDESSRSTLSLLDDSQNKDKNENSEETLLKNSDSENEDLSISGKLEIEGDLDNVRIENINTSDPENSVASAKPAPMHISDGELTVTANEDVEEESSDKFTNDSILIDEMLPSDTLDVELTVAASKDAEEELKNSNINEGIVIDEMLPPDTSDVELTVSASEDAEEELQDTSINEGILIEEMPPSETLSDTSDVELMVSASEVAEEELKDTNIIESTLTDEIPPSTSLDVELTVPASMEVEEELRNKNINESNVIDEMSPSDTSDDVKSTIAASEDAEEELKNMNICESTLADQMPPSDTSDVELTVAASNDDVDEMQDADKKESTLMDKIPPSDTLDVDLMVAATEDVVEGVKDTNMNESTLIDKMQPSDTLDVELTVAACVDDVEELKDTNINEITLIDEMLPSDTSDAKLMVAASEDVKEELIGMNIGEVMLIDEMPSSDLLAIEPTLIEVSQIQLHVNVEEKTMDTSSTESVDVQNWAMEDELQEVITEIKENSEGDAEDLLPPSTMNISDTEQTDAANEDMDIGEAILLDGLLPSNALGAEQISEVVSQLESSQSMLEATMEVSTTKSMNVEDQAVENELPEVSSDNWAENDIANMMLAKQTIAEEVSEPNSTHVELKPTMQLSDIEVQDKATSLAINDDAGDSYINNAEQASYQLELQAVQDAEVIHSMLEQSLENDSLESSILLKGSDFDPQLEVERNEDNISSIGLVEASADTALLLVAETEVIREEIYITGDFLSSGAALLEHPSKALTGGDDAYFVAGGKWLGVANGVHQWSFEGTDPGVFAQELMRTCQEIVMDNSSVSMTNPVELLCKSVKEANMSGSSNVLIANFDGQALHVANIGDTGFLIIRHGAIYKKSSPLLHEFHFALQVEDCDDPLELVEEHTIELEEGDLVVSATDGLFDNLYEREIAMIVSKSFQAGMKPEEIANALATRAQDVGKSVKVRSPFSDAAQAAGYTGYAGGKPDNVAVIVSLVEKRSILSTG